MLSKQEDVNNCINKLIQKFQESGKQNIFF